MFFSTRRLPFLALAAAGLLWGTTVPLTKLALTALDPGWLSVVRFLVAAVPLLLLTRRTLAAALTPVVAGWGVAGYGLVILLQSIGIQHTSVSHAALLAGAVPAMVAVIALLLRRGTAGGPAWAGYALALAGIALVASGGGGGAALTGDALVVAALLVSAGYTVAQPNVLAGRDPAAVTAVQFLAAGLACVPVAMLRDGAPTVHGGPGVLLAVLALVVAGTLAPFTLFAWGQARTTPEVAGAFLNLEPVVGAGAGALAFGDPFGRLQLVGAAAVLGGIALSALPARLLREAAGRAHRPDRAGRARSGRVQRPLVIGNPRAPESVTDCDQRPVGARRRHTEGKGWADHQRQMARISAVRLVPCY